MWGANAAMRIKIQEKIPMASLPETVKAELDRAIHSASFLRGGYVPGGLTDFSRNRKLPIETL